MSVMSLFHYKNFGETGLSRELSRRGQNLLKFHFDPREIEDTRETEWKATPNADKIPSVEFGEVKLREVSFTLLFDDLGWGGVTRTPLGQDGYYRTKESLLWLRRRQQSYAPFFTKPPLLMLMNGVCNDLTGTNTFVCVLAKVHIKSKIIAGKEVILRRNELISFPGVKPGEVVRAEVEITLKEYPDVTAGDPQTASGNFNNGRNQGRSGQ